MTALNSGTALLILVVFVLPGFVAVLVRERIYEVRGEDSSFDRLLTTVYYSLLVWAVPTVAAIAAGAHRDDVERFLDGRSPLWLTGCIALCVLLVLPVVISLRDGQRLAAITAGARTAALDGERETSSSRRDGSPPAMAWSWRAPHPTTLVCGSTPMTSSPLSTTLSRMRSVKKSKPSKSSDAKPRRTPPGIVARGRQPVTSHPLPDGPFPIGPPFWRPGDEKK